jgi:transposase
MIVRRHFSQEFKDAIITKIVNRGSKTVVQVCADEGISLSTAYAWLSRDTVPVMKNKARAKKWSAKEKLQAVSETLSMTEGELGIYLRKAGLHSQQLDDWRSQILTSLDVSPKIVIAKDERDAQIKDLEREILRKDKALAEASALLILQKKVDLIWGGGGQK